MHGRDSAVRPPVEAYLRVIDEPVIRLTSVDLEASARIEHLDEVFDFGRDYLGLLKAAIIAAGIVPPGIERSGTRLADLLASIFGPGRGFELISNVNRIPKGSRLAVSTNLLGALIGVCMRATGQIAALEGPMQEGERRMVAARAILGEWLGGSGGGWQDSGGLWPGIKLIEGTVAKPGDPEYGTSHGCLLPRHTLLGLDRVSADARRKLQDSLVLVHGGMAQNVGPILEMVTEKYLLRGEAEWKARRHAVDTLDAILGLLAAGDMRGLGKALTENFFGPLQAIIPWVTNLYTERLIAETRKAFGEDFWGFWMLGGMSGGGMGFVFSPERKAEGQDRLLSIMLKAKRDLQDALPFAMDPVVYDFAINEAGSVATVLSGSAALLPAAYYRHSLPPYLRREARDLTLRERNDVQQFTLAARTIPEFSATLPSLLDQLLPSGPRGESHLRLRAMLLENGFDPAQHEQIRSDLKNGRIGLALNRMPATTKIEDVDASELFDPARATATMVSRGEQALRAGEVAMVCYSAGVGSRWTQGAGVVKGIHPFAKFGGRHRSFIEVHLAKARRCSEETGATIPYVFTTSHLTHEPIEKALKALAGDRLNREVWISPGRSIGLRLVPTLRDLHLAWEETAQQRRDEQKEKRRESVRATVTNWARGAGEASDYTDNLPGQCLHPVGHWFEIPNLLKNGVLARLLKAQPNLRTLLAHNIDTLGATPDPAMAGWFRDSGAVLGFEVMSRRIEDHGGGLARIDGRLRQIEGFALPREQDEFTLSYYTTNTCWIDIDRLLALFGLRRADLADPVKTAAAVRELGSRLSTYVTLKEVKKRWGHGQEDVYPVAQFEKLWGDMSALQECQSAFALVPRSRGQQLKEQSQLDGWQRDGSARAIEALCRFD